MVIDAADPDTRSVGSFFMNPVVAPTFMPTAMAAVRRWWRQGFRVRRQ